MANNTKKAGGSGTVTVEQFASPARRNGAQLQTLIGLGLNKIGRKKTLKDSPQVRGMIAKISHMVRVVEG